MYKSSLGGITPVVPGKKADLKLSKRLTTVGEIKKRSSININEDGQVNVQVVEFD